MRGVALILLALVAFLSNPALRAEEADDKTRLERFLEERLSGPGYQVTIEGFEGALSSEAHVDRITIADDGGPWLEIEDASLRWRRAALLRGRLEIDELVAAKITMHRRPSPSDQPFTPEAKDFTLPELPVSVNIGRIEAQDITLGRPVLGTEVAGTVSGTVRLDDAGGEVILRARRTDNRRGRLELAARLARADGNLTLRLVLDEGPDGVLANLLNVPDRPALLFEMTASGTARNFAGRFGLASGGASRLSGTLRLAQDDTSGQTRAELAVNGDIRPLLPERHRRFFDAGITLRMKALRDADGGVTVPALHLVSGAMTLDGQARLSADLVPQFLEIEGRLATADDPWLVPLPGRDVRLGTAGFRVSLTPRKGDNLVFRLAAGQLSLPSLSIEEVDARATGRVDLESGAFSVIALATGNGVSAHDPALERLVGNQPRASGRIAWDGAGPLRLRALTLEGANLRTSFDGEAGIAPTGLRLAGKATADVHDLRPIGAMMDRDLGGTATATADGELVLPSGAFDVRLEARASGARTGISALDSLLGSSAELTAAAKRGTDGLSVEALRLEGDGGTLEGRGRISSAGGELSGTARLVDIGRLAPGFTGPATASLRGVGGAEGWQIEASAKGPGGASAAARGRAFLPDGTHDLHVDAQFPLGLFGQFVAPRRMAGDVTTRLRLKGPARISAISGTVTLRSGSLSAPALRLSLDAVEGTADISGGVARLALRGRGREGGRLSLGGTLDLGARGLPAALELELARLVVRDRLLFDTAATGRVTLAGKLAQGIDIAGKITLDTTEIRIAPVGRGAAALPRLRHVNAPPEVRRTLARAGIGEGNAPTPFPIGLDVEVTAPRLFLRGYGVDAEFGGRVRLGGTLADVVPAGGFDLRRGRISLLGRRFDLVAGTLRTRGTFTPDVELVAEAKSADGVVVRIELSGPANEPDISVMSDPPLPEEEALAHLFFSRGSASLSPLQALQLANALTSLSGRKGVVERLRLGFGLDNLDVRQDADTTTFALGKYVTENAYTEVTVDTEGRSTISLNLDIGRNLTAKARLSEDRETGLGLFWQRDY